MSYGRLEGELYQHLQNMKYANKIYPIKDWDVSGEQTLENLIQEYFIDANHYISKNGMYVLIGIDGREFVNISFHSPYINNGFLNENDVDSIKIFLKNYKNQPFEYVLRSYTFRGALIAIIWFATPEMVAEMKDAKELLFSEDDTTTSFEKDTLPSNEPVEEKKSTDSIQVETDEQSFSLEKQESLEVIEQTLDASKKDEPTEAKDMNTTATVGDDNNSKIIELLKVISDQELSTKKIMAKLGLAENARKCYTDNYRKPAESLDLIEKTVKDKPNSKLQKYRLTQLGQKKLARLN